MGKVDLEILLMNTLKLTTGKVQDVVNTFMLENEYISIFCFTETKVEFLDFIPNGISIITKHRRLEDKKEDTEKGGLAIGYLTIDKKN